MRIIAKCPKCGNNWILDSSVADKRISCRKCGSLFKVPKLEELPKAINLIKKAKGPVYVDRDGKTYG